MPWIFRVASYVGSKMFAYTNQITLNMHYRQGLRTKWHLGNQLSRHQIKLVLPNVVVFKAEKERRLKEKNQANTKKFMDERKNTTMKQNKKREKQKKLHETQLQEISQYIKSVSENNYYFKTWIAKIKINFALFKNGQILYVFYTYKISMKEAS